MMPSGRQNACNCYRCQKSFLTRAPYVHGITACRHDREAEIGTGNKLDFASLLDDLIVASEKGEEEGARPSIPFDYLSVADELHSGRIKVAGESVAAEYRESGADLAAEFAALLDQAKLTLAGEAHRPEGLAAGRGQEPTSNT